MGLRLAGLFGKMKTATMKRMRSGILGGNLAQGKWLQGDSTRPMTWFEAKGVLESVFERLGLQLSINLTGRLSAIPDGLLRYGFRGSLG